MTRQQAVNKFARNFMAMRNRMLTAAEPDDETDECLDIIRSMSAEDQRFIIDAMPDDDVRRMLDWIEEDE